MRGERQRIEHLAQRGGAVEAADAFEQPRDAGHFDLALLDARLRHRRLHFVGGLGLRIGQHRARCGFGVGDGLPDLRLELGLDLAAHFARRGSRAHRSGRS